MLGGRLELSEEAGMAEVPEITARASWIEITARASWADSSCPWLGCSFSGSREGCSAFTGFV
jgi:hypothetical protein